MLKNILSIFGGAIGAQLIGLLVAPIVTRVYLPEAFGMMAIVWAVISVVGVVACLAYEKVIVLEHDDHDARRLVTLCTYLALLSAGIVSGGVCVFDTFIYKEYFSIGYVGLFVFLGVYVFGARKALDFYATRVKRFRLIAVSMLLGAAIGALWKITVGVMWGASGEVLLMGNIIGAIIPAITLYYYLKDDLREEPPGRDKAGLELLLRHSEFPKKQVPNALLATLQQQAPVFILTAYFGSEIVGFYGLAMAVLLRPVRALVGAASRVYLQRISNLRGDAVHTDLLKNSAMLSMLALPFCLVLFLYGEALFKLLFGEKWGEAGHMASLMAPWVFMLIVNVPTTQTLIAKRALNYLLGFNAVYMITRVSGMLVAIYLTGDVYTSILVFSLIGFAANVIYISKGLAVARNG